MGKLDVSRLMAAPGTERWRGVRSLLPVFEGVVSFGCDELGTVLTSAVVSEMGSAPRFFSFFGRETVPVFFLFKILWQYVLRRRMYGRVGRARE